ILPDMVDPGVMILPDGTFLIVAVNFIGAGLPDGIYTLTSEDGRTFDLRKDPIIRPSSPNHKPLDPAIIALGDDKYRVYYWEVAEPVEDTEDKILSATGKLEVSLAMYFAQFGDGQGLTSELLLTNPSATLTASGRADFLDDNGLSLAVSFAGQVASSVDFSIAPLGVVTISTDGQGDLVVGSAVVTSDNNVGGVMRFSIANTGIAGVGKSQPLSGFIIPVRRKLGGINTGIAIHNTESQAVTLNLTLRDPQGQEVANGAKTIENLPAGGHLAQFIDELFLTAETDDFEGTLVVQVTGGKVAATALELGTEAGQFTTLPVTALQ
ncbi:hypothetical protein MYX84_14785, partial [Acidobacteria bacterium AH-259-O06]|nr:hypothetical protein [Acidobacteria bacterium AH-259-O06]